MTHVVLVHQADELVRILGIGGVTGFVNFARELVGVIGVFEGVLIARFLQEGRVILDRFEPSVVFSEAGLNRDESAVLPFLGLVRRRASRARALDAEEVFGRSDRRFTPTRFEGGLG